MTTLDERIEAARKLEGYTPGPWRVGIDDDGNPLSGRPGVFSSDELDCGIVHWDGFVQKYWRSARGDKEIHDNARLIAAAPDLHRLVLDLAAEREQLLTALRLHKAWADSERTGPDYGGQSRDTHPDGERIWRQWWDNQLDLCDRAQTATDAALASETRA